MLNLQDYWLHIHDRYIVDRFPHYYAVAAFKVGCGFMHTANAHDYMFCFPRLELANASITFPGSPHIIMCTEGAVSEGTVSHSSHILQAGQDERRSTKAPVAATSSAGVESGG